MDTNNGIQQVSIPPQLRVNAFRFLLLEPKSKEPLKGKTKDWQKSNNFPYDAQRLTDHLASGGNYGIIGGYGNIVIIDADSEEIDYIAREYLPETFTVKGNPKYSYKKHYYFFSKEKIKPIRFTKQKVGDLGDVRSTGQYVVAPNSKHPEGEKYTVIKDIPIAEVTQEEILSAYSQYIERKEFYEILKPSARGVKRKDEYVEHCKMPEYLKENKIKGNTGKNWTLFRYIADILYNKNENYHQEANSIISMQGHELGAILGWLKYAEAGTLRPSSCQQMREYINHYHPDSKPSICGVCPISPENKNQQNVTTLKNAIWEFRDYLDMAERFREKQPIYYDKNKLWWLWNHDSYKWEMLDETDILNTIDQALQVKTETWKQSIKGEILECLRRVGRKHAPKLPPETWIQFKDQIYDLKTKQVFDASSEYFITNPIAWKLGESEDTPVMDLLFREWIIKEGVQDETYVMALYEILAYSLLRFQPLQRLFVLTGEGANGKGVFTRLLKKLVGEGNYCTTDMVMLTTRSFESTVLYKKLVCLIGEVSSDDMKNTNLIKGLTGEDTIRYEFKGKNAFSDVNYATMVITTNSLPTTPDKTLGFYRRWFIVDFPNTFGVGEDVLMRIPDEEYENLCLKLVWIAQGLLETKKFTNEGDFGMRTNRYEERSNPLIKFVNEMYSSESGAEYTIFGFLFKDLEIYLKDRKLKPVSRKELSSNLRKMGFSIQEKKFPDETDKDGKVVSWKTVLVVWGLSKKVITSEEKMREIRKY